MARPRRRLTKRERIFGWVGWVVSLAIFIAATIATRFFLDMGVVGILLIGWVAVLVVAWGRAVGLFIARKTDPGRGATPPLVARKVPKDTWPLWRQRFPAVVEMVLGLTVLFLFAGVLIQGVMDMVGGTAPVDVPVAVFVAVLAAVGAILFWRGWKRWRRLAQGAFSRLAETR